MFAVERNTTYDFAGQSYADSFPNLHKYPATMIPQLGIQILSELNITNGRLLDPYCGSGSSIVSGLKVGLTKFDGYDINPLAILISRAKFTYVMPEQLWDMFEELVEYIQVQRNAASHDIQSIPNFKNRDYWFADWTLQRLGIISDAIHQMIPKSESAIFWVAFVETVRKCSYTRDNEFKLYRIPENEMSSFSPKVLEIFHQKLKLALENYVNYYLPLLNSQSQIHLHERPYELNAQKYNVVLTSPPYGDSRTTVAYGQFSLFANEWMQYHEPRKIDKQLMGGRPVERLYRKCNIASKIQEIDKKSHKRALEVSSFYHDLECSIHSVSKAVKLGGYAIYVVGNRRVQDVVLTTDQFIAECFEASGYQHLFTYERSLSNKVMPSKNSPTNKVGHKRSTMTSEYIVVCQKVTSDN